MTLEELNKKIEELKALREEMDIWRAENELQNLQLNSLKELVNSTIEFLEMVLLPHQIKGNSFKTH